MDMSVIADMGWGEIIALFGAKWERVNQIRDFNIRMEHVMLII